MKIELATLHNPFSRPSSLAHLDPEFDTIHRITNRKRRRSILKIGIFANAALTVRNIVEKWQALYIMIDQSYIYVL